MVSRNQLGDFDVAIVGGGPAGAAVAISLRQHESSLSLALVEGTELARRRVGESLSPLAHRLLAHLAVADLVGAPHAVESHGSAASWGSAELRPNEFFLGTHGPGWQLDRAAFDGALVARAEDRGTVVLRGARVERIEREDGRRCLRLSTGARLRARFVVDATGRRASIARRCGARCEALDQMVGIVNWFEDDGGEDPRTVVEATADGWWYTAGLPCEGRVVAFMTDRDIAVGNDLQHGDGWRRALGHTRHMSTLLAGREPFGPTLVRATESKRCDPAWGPDWLAVGDAASTYDPLSSQGIAKAMQSGIFASYAIADQLVRADDAGLRRYGRFVRTEFARYERTRRRYYRVEDRWPEREFWRRRQSAVVDRAVAAR